MIQYPTILLSKPEDIEELSQKYVNGELKVSLINTSRGNIIRELFKIDINKSNYAVITLDEDFIGCNETVYYSFLELFNFITLVKFTHNLGGLRYTIIIRPVINYTEEIAKKSLKTFKKIIPDEVYFNYDLNIGKGIEFPIPKQLIMKGLQPYYFISSYSKKNLMIYMSLLIHIIKKGGNLGISNTDYIYNELCKYRFFTAAVFTLILSESLSLDKLTSIIDEWELECFNGFETLIRSSLNYLYPANAKQEILKKVFEIKNHGEITTDSREIIKW